MLNVRDIAYDSILAIISIESLNCLSVNNHLKKLSLDWEDCTCTECSLSCDAYIAKLLVII